MGKAAILNDPNVVTYPKNYNSKQRFTIKCVKCYNDYTIPIESYDYRRKTRSGNWLCNKCLKPTIIAESNSKNSHLFRRKSLILNDDNIVVKPKWYYPPNCQISIKCDKCNKICIIKVGSYIQARDRDNSKWICKKCKQPRLTSELVKRNKIRAVKSLILTNDPQVIIKPNSFDSSSWFKIKCNKCEIISDTSVGNYYRRKCKRPGPWICHACLKPILIAESKSNSLYNNQAYRKRFADLHKDINYRNKVHNERAYEKIRKAAIVAYQNNPCVSSLQELLYGILRDLNIKHYREYKPGDPLIPQNTKKIIIDGKLKGYVDPECHVAEFNLDCVIPTDKKWLLIDVHGNYPHSRSEVIQRDKIKASYIVNNLSHQYTYKVIWEHEFADKNKVIELLKYWTGIAKLELMNFDFKDVQIKDCQADEYKQLLGKYHYLTNAGRGGIVYGAYLNNELIAVCVFSPLVRQNINKSLKSNTEHIRELSRFCIHPRYQKKNFASWFISRCINKLDEKYKIIISYADTTFNHNGTIYKAANFKLDREVAPDYHYVKNDGWIMHKKTLYNHAISLGLIEHEFAEKYGYKKVWGKKKLRFVYRR